jgi:hypothetical protein
VFLTSRNVFLEVFRGVYNKFKLKFNFIAHVGVKIGVAGFYKKKKNTHTQNLCEINSKER